MTTNEDVLALLSQYSYQQVSEMTGWSRGRIYAVALKAGQRKTEARIRERASERLARQTAFLLESMNSTAKADVLDFLDGLPSDSIALHITSVPYNIGKSYGDAPGADCMAFGYYHGWLMQVISEMARTLIPGGVIALQVGKTRDQDGRLLPLDVLLFENLRNAGLQFQSRVVWTVPHGLTPSNRLAERHETMLIFSKGDPVFNPNAARIPQKQPDKRAFKGPNRGQLSGNPYGAHPTDVWADIGNVGNNHPERIHGAHPAQFPVELARRAILLYTKPGQTICDCFAGSGSSMVAAVETGRNFTGCDLFYEDLRSKRIAAAQPDQVCMLPGVTETSIAIWQAEARRKDVAAKPISSRQEIGMIADLFGNTGQEPTALVS